MSEAKLDQLVKGTPIPESDPTVPAAAASVASLSTPSTSDPLAALPSSPPQIYLNLLILEASLRAQFLELRARRRQYTFFLTLLAAWIAYFGYALFFAPREDGSGVGGSVYWVVEVTQKVAFMGGIVTGVLVWGTGQWERGIRWPRRWLAVTNRGLRGFNVKVVVNKRSWWQDLLSALRFYLSTGLLSSDNVTTYRYVEPALVSEADREAGIKPGSRLHTHDRDWHEEDLAPGGDVIKLLLLPKPFSPSFRENWDVYRQEYWEKENERRLLLRNKLKVREKHLAKEHGIWFWWTGWRAWTPTPPDLEKRQTRHAHHHSHGSVAERQRLRSGSLRGGTSSSRSSTPSRDVESTVPSHVRRASTSSTASDRSERRRSRASSSRAKVPRMSPSVSSSGGPSPDAPSSLKREMSISSTDSENKSSREGSVRRSRRGRAASARAAESAEAS